MAVALVAMAAICLVPAESADADYYDVNSETNLVGVGDDLEVDIVYTNNDYNDSTQYPNMNMSISYEATLRDSSGNTVSNGVDDESGDLESGIPTTLTVSAPDDAGRCTLEVVFTAEVTYTVVDEEGDEPEEKEETETVTRTVEYDIRVVEPITLSVSVTNESDVSLQNFGVYFQVDGQTVEDSYQTINLDGRGSTTVTYEWITDAGNGQHTYALIAAGESTATVSGLGETHTFYIGDNDYTWLTALLIVVIVVVLLVMVWVYRKPVKNYGKPKSRR